MLLYPVTGSLPSPVLRRERSAFCAARLPLADRSVDALTDTERQALAKHWLRRGRSEQRVGIAFAKMVPLLRAVGAHDVVLRLLDLASADERSHAEICVELAGRYAARRLDPLPLGGVPLPEFGCDDERLEAALLVTGMCCINETLATVWIELSLSASTAPLAVAANRAHLRDEIDHARLGWAHLGSDALDPALRDELADCIPGLLSANLPLWLDPDPVIPREGIAGHGQPPHAEIERAVRRAVKELLLPGFRHVGVRPPDIEG